MLPIRGLELRFPPGFFFQKNLLGVKQGHKKTELMAVFYFLQRIDFFRRERSFRERFSVK